jgi:hypothetical protein
MFACTNAHTEKVHNIEILETFPQKKVLGCFVICDKVKIIFWYFCYSFEPFDLNLLDPR